MYGKERDLVLYDRLTQKELYSISNVSMSTKWKEIRYVPHPDIDSTDFIDDDHYWFTFYRLSMSRIYLAIDDEHVVIVQLDFSVNKDSPRYRKFTFEELKINRRDGFEISLEYANI